MTIHRPDHPEGLLNNCVAVINCLPPHELQTAKSIYDGLLDLQYETPRRQIRYFPVIKGRDHLVEILKAYSKKYPDFEPFPIIHIEAHGDHKRGLEVVPGEFMPWPQLFAECQNINKGCDNNFGLVLASCHGYELSELVKVLQPSPFNFMISATQEVRAGVAKRVLLDSYGALFRDLALQRACTSLPRGFGFFHCRNFFALEMAHAYKKFRLGKGRAAMVEKQLSRAMSHGFVKQVLGVKKARKIMRSAITPNRKDFEEKSRVFFHGRVPIDFDDFMHFVRTERWPDQLTETDHA